MRVQGAQRVLERRREMPGMAGNVSAGTTIQTTQKSSSSLGGGDNEEAIARVHPLVRRSVHARRVVRLGELYLFHHQRWEY